MKRWWFAVGVAAAAAAEAVPPVVLTNVVVQKYGEERTLEVQPEGMLFIDEYGDLYMGNGETAGGVKVCAHVEIDWHVWEKDVEANGHAIKWNRYWKQLSEGGSLSYRYGTNTFLRLVGAESGTLANINVDTSHVGTGTLVISADNPDAVLQVSTNLMEAGAWQTATNAELTAQSDVSRTWTITLMGTSAEFYRAMGEVSVGSGIHAMRPLYAHQGITDADGAAVTNWGDLTNSLSARIDAAVGGVETNAGNIATNAAAIAGNTAAIAAHAANIYSNAAGLSWITNALGQRVSEYETVSLGITPTMSTTQANVWLVPTNCPTRNLHISVNAATFTSTNYPLTLRVPGDWTPTKPIRIRFLFTHAGSSARINIHIGTAARASGATPATSPRLGELQWLPEIGLWQWYWIAENSINGLYTVAGAASPGATSNLPATIEDWIAWRSQQPW